MELEESVLDNMRHLVEPYLVKLAGSQLTDKHRLYLDIQGSHLKELTSPFVHRVSAKFLGLTPREIRVAELIRQARISKEIASILRCSERAVVFHRRNIRKKLGLRGAKRNLQTYLSMFTQGQFLPVLLLQFFRPSLFAACLLIIAAKYLHSDEK